MGKIPKQLPARRYNKVDPEQHLDPPLIRFLRDIVLDGVQEVVFPADPTEEEGFDVESSLDMNVRYEFKTGQIIAGKLTKTELGYTLMTPDETFFPEVPADAVEQMT